MLPYCKFHGIGVIPYSPLAGGLLARPRESAETPRHKLSSSLGLIKMDEADTEIIKRVEEIAKKRDWTMSQVCPCPHSSRRYKELTNYAFQVGLAWVQRNVTSPISGANSVERVDQAIVDAELTDEEAAYLGEP